MFCPGQTVPPPGIELGGSERVVRAAGQAAKRNPAPPSSVEKTRAAWRGTCHEGFSGAAHIVEAARGKKSPRPFSEDGKKKRGDQISYVFSRQRTALSRCLET